MITYTCEELLECWCGAGAPLVKIPPQVWKGCQPGNRAGKKFKPTKPTHNRFCDQSQKILIYATSMLIHILDFSWFIYIYVMNWAAITGLRNMNIFAVMVILMKFMVNFLLLLKNKWYMYIKPYLRAVRVVIGGKAEEGVQLAELEIKLCVVGL